MLNKFNAWTILNKLFCSVRITHYLCNRQLVILIYIYHFPNWESVCEDRFPLFFHLISIPYS